MSGNGWVISSTLYNGCNWLCLKLIHVSKMDPRQEQTYLNEKKRNNLWNFAYWRMYLMQTTYTYTAGHLMEYFLLHELQIFAPIDKNFYVIFEILRTSVCWNMRMFWFKEKYALSLTLVLTTLDTGKACKSILSRNCPLPHIKQWVPLLIWINLYHRMD